MEIPLFIFLLLLLAAAGSYLYWKRNFGRPGRSFPGVLAYHKIDGFEFSGTWISPRRFAYHIDYLLDSGFTFINEDTFIDVLEGRREGSGRELLLTFDDGYSDLLDQAAPILNRRSVPALAFVVTSYAGRENRWELGLPRRKSRHLDWQQLGQLMSMGFSLGSHTATHRDLTRIPAEQARRELITSREVISQNLGVEVKSLSYPFGRAGPEIRAEAEKAGYRLAFSLYPPFKNSRIDPFMLRREGVYLIDSAFTVKCKLSRGNAFWMEDLKGRAINAVSVLTPVFKEMGPGE